MKRENRSPKSAFAYASVGIQLSATILICVIGGYKLDQHYGKSPVFLITGTVVGMVVGFYSLLKELLSTGSYNSNSNDRDKNRNKWM